MRREDGRFRGAALARVWGTGTESGEEAADRDVFEGDGMTGGIFG